MPLRELLGLNPSADAIAAHIRGLQSGAATVDPEVKSYPDAVYFNYHALGISLLFSPKNGYKPKVGLASSEIDKEKLSLDSIDIYNIPALRQSTTGQPKAVSSRPAELAFSTYPVSTITLSRVVEAEGKPNLDITPETSGKHFVERLGEPERKGGGAGPSSGSIGIWCEWSREGIMVEFGGEEARGPQAWERGKDAVWRVITVFPPKSA